jgi:hypothetical protein
MGIVILIDRACRPSSSAFRRPVERAPYPSIHLVDLVRGDDAGIAQGVPPRSAGPQRAAMRRAHVVDGAPAACLCFWIE